AAGQAHLHLPHEGGRAQQYRLPPDGGGVAALLIKAEIVHFLIMAALAAEQAVKQPLKAAVRRPGHRGGIGGNPGQVLPEHLYAVELDRTRREQVSVRQDHGPPAADLLRTAPARHGAPRLVKVPGQPGEWHPPAQRQGKGGACPQDGRPVQQKVVPPFLAQGAEPGKHDGGHQHHRHQRVLPHGGGILPQGGGVEA
ncbi:aminoacyl-tRNA hydrolase, partial [Dysosmobacter welbionis]